MPNSDSAPTVDPDLTSAIRGSDSASKNIQLDSSAQKLESAEKLNEMSTGSSWTAVATENAAGTTVEANKKATDDFLKSDARIKIHHEPRKVLNVSQEAVTTPKAAPKTQPQKQANQSDATVSQSTEDGIVLRWR